MTNDHLVLISGKSATGKSASLRDIQNQPGVVYLNCDMGKKLPFKNDFKNLVITDCAVIYQAFDQAEERKDIHTIIIDTLTYMLDLYETTRVLTVGEKESRKAWGNYAQFFKRLMSDKVAKSTKNVIFLAHSADLFNETEMVTETLVKVKGSLMNNGIESYFTNVISSKKLALAKFTKDNADSPLFQVTPQEEALRFKYVFQTTLTKETVNERIRAPMGMWTPKETYIDNNVQLVIQRLTDYYCV